MLITIQELEIRKVEFDETFPPEAIDLTEDVRLGGPIRVQGRAELITENHGPEGVVEDIRLVGRYSADVEQRCARCLEPVTGHVAEDFDLLYRPISTLKRGEEVEITLAETEIGYFQGKGLLLEDVLKEQVLLALPQRALCNTECKGLCPHCGVNRNQKECECVDATTDPRWDALKDLRDKLQN